VAVVASPDVEQAVVIPRIGRDGEQRLVGYVVPRAGSSIDPAQLRHQLQTRLPNHMVPASIGALSSLPLRPSGNIGRRALPEPDTARPNNSTQFVLPVTELEQQIAQAWSEVLKLDRVGVEDNFFEVGGHSLLLVKLQSRLGGLTSKEITILDLFRH